MYGIVDLLLGYCHVTMQYVGHLRDVHCSILMETYCALSVAYYTRHVYRKHDTTLIIILRISPYRIKS